MGKNKIKFNYIDLFAGCGGLSDGFEQTDNFEPLACVEWDQAACATLAKRLENKWCYKDSGQRVIRFDIQRTEDLINGWEDDPIYGSSVGFNNLIKEKKVDLIIGGPPCQAYSIAGRVRDKDGMKNDYRNYLFQSYLKLTDYYKPDIFIFENVLGMLSAMPDGELIVDKIREGFDSIGYEITDNLSKNAVFDLSQYGVPQSRTRVIIIGLRKDSFNINRQAALDDLYHNIIPKYKSKKISTVKDAISDLPAFKPLKAEIKENGKKYSHFPLDTDFYNHSPRYHNKRDIEIFRELAEDAHFNYGKYNCINDLKKLYTKKTGKTSSVHKYNVLNWNEPSNTIVAHLYKDGLRHIHPDYKQARSITVREAARLQSFDDDFEFLGSQGDQYKMIGNAVPPLFAKALALAITEFMSKNIKNKNKELCETFV